MEADLIKIILTAFATGAVSTLATVKALHVHITYINNRLDRHEQAIQRSHERIDLIERGKTA